MVTMIKPLWTEWTLLNRPEGTYCQLINDVMIMSALLRTMQEFKEFS